MKKYLLSAAIIAITFILGGCQQSVEHRIKRDFKNYVRMSFDNPKDLLEIVSISEVPDTIYAPSLAYLAVEGRTVGFNLIDSYRSIMDSLMNLPSRKNPTTSTILKALQVFEKVDAIFKKEDQLQENFNVYINITDSIEYKNYPTYYDYEIRARVKTDDKIKLQSFHALTTNTDSIFTIHNREIIFSDLDEDSEELCEKATNIMNYMKEYIELEKERLDLTNEFTRIIKQR